MNLEFEKGRLSFDFEDAIQSLSLEEKTKLVESLSCDGEIIKHVVAQVLDKWTENGCYGGKYVTAVAEPTSGLDWACRQVALRSGDVAADEIKRLQHALAIAQKEVQSVYKMLQDERHHYQLASNLQPANLNSCRT